MDFLKLFVQFLKMVPIMVRKRHHWICLTGSLEKVVINLLRRVAISFGVELPVSKG